MTATDKLTASTITTAQIKALRAQAESSSDSTMVDICDRAMSTDDSTTDQDGNEVACADLSRDEARQSCADEININNARALEQ